MAAKTKVTLPTGFTMPSLGFGTWQSKDDDLEKALEAALEAGYRHIDTACLYENEHVIGKVLSRWFADGKLKREDVFVVTKLPSFGNRASDVEQYIKESLEKLQLSYLDLYLIHVPMGVNKGGPDGKDWQIDSSTDLIALWKAMENQVDAGRTRTIGVSNFNQKQVQRILDAARIPPVTNQIEHHVYLQQPQLIDFLAKNNITVTAYSPLGTPGITKFYALRGMKKEVPDILNNPVVLEVAEKHKKTAAQVLLRHIVQRGIAAIPKSTNPDRIKQNIDIFNFELDANDMQKLNNLDNNTRIVTFEVIKGVKNHPEYPF